jgi:hypothetical protein
MPVSNNFLAGLLPAANGYFAPQSVAGAVDPNDPLLGGQSAMPPQVAPGQVPIPMAPPPDMPAGPPEAMSRGPAFESPPADPLLGGASREPVPASVLNMSAPPPQAPPPEPPAPGAPQPKLIATMSPGTKAREVDVAGQRQLGLIGGATEKRVGGVEAAVEGQDKSQQAIIDAANQGIAEQTARQEAARQTMAKNQAQLDEDQRKIDEATKMRAETPMTDYWADKSTGSRVMATLGLAMGAFAASLRGTQNGALQMLNADMDRDLKTKQQRYMQEKGKIDATRDAAQNAFNNHVRQFGMAGASDIEAGAQRQKLAYEAQKMAATAKRPEIQGQGAQIAQNLQADADEYKAKALIKYVPPTAKGVQYTDPNIGIPMTRGEALKWRQQNITQESSQEGKLAVAALKGGASGKKLQDTNRRFIAEKLQSADVPGSLAALKAAQEDMDKNDKGIDPISTGVWAKGAAGRFAYKKMWGPVAARREQEWSTTANRVGKAIAGVAVNPAEEQRLAQQLKGAGDADARRVAMQQAEEYLLSQQRSVFAGAGQEATDEYKTNLARETPEKIDFKPAAAEEKKSEEKDDEE